MFQNQLIFEKNDFFLPKFLHFWFSEGYFPGEYRLSSKFSGQV